MLVCPLSQIIRLLKSRSNRLSDQRAVGPMGCRTNGPWKGAFFPFFVGPVACRTNGLSEQWAVGPMSNPVWIYNTNWSICRTNGLSDYWAVGPMGCRTNGLSDQWAFGTAGCPRCKTPNQKVYPDKTEFRLVGNKIADGKNFRKFSQLGSLALTLHYLKMLRPWCFYAGHLSDYLSRLVLGLVNISFWWAVLSVIQLPHPTPHPHDNNNNRKKKQEAQGPWRCLNWRPSTQECFLKVLNRICYLRYMY